MVVGEKKKRKDCRLYMCIIFVQGGFVINLTTECNGLNLAVINK